MLHVERVPLESYEGKRTSAVLHSFSGVHVPLVWDDLLTVLQPLTRGIRPWAGDVILSLDGPAMVPALALSALLGLKIVFATKMDLARSPKIRFEEPASPRPHIYVYGLRRKMSVIIVDEGVTTGDTLCSCIAALKREGVMIRAIVTVLEARKYGAREKIRALGYELLSVATHDHEIVA